MLVRNYTCRSVTLLESTWRGSIKHELTGIAKSAFFSAISDPPYRMPMAVVQRQTFGTLIIRDILQHTAKVNRVDSGVLQVTLSITRHRKIRVQVIL